MNLGINEGRKVSGEVYALQFSSKNVPNYEVYRALLGRHEAMDKALADELVKERIASSWVPAIHPRFFLRRALPRFLWRKNNLIVNVALAALVAEVTAGTAFELTYCGVGSGTTTPAAADTALTTVISPYVAVTAAYAAANNVAEWDTFFGTAANAGTWAESGLFTLISAGTMGCHALFAATIAKSTSNTEVVAWKWTF